MLGALRFGANEVQTLGLDDGALSGGAGFPVVPDEKMLNHRVYSAAPLIAKFGLRELAESANSARPQKCGLSLTSQLLQFLALRLRTHAGRLV